MKKIKKISFYFTAVKNNNKEEGTIDASNKILAMESLWQQGYQSIAIKKINFFFLKRVKYDHITVFFKQLLVLLSANLPVIHSINLLLHNMQFNHLKLILLSVRYDIDHGLTLSDALIKHRLILDEWCCQLIAYGEHSGTLLHALNQVIAFRLKYSDFRQKMIGILFYPLIITGFSAIVVLIMLFYIIPKFGSLLLAMGAKLPYCTAILLAISQHLNHYIIFYVFILLLTIIVFFWQKDTLKKMLRRMPYIRTIYIKTFVIRLCDILHTGLNAGIMLDRIFALSRTLLQDAQIIRDIDRIVEQIQAGYSLSYALKSCKWVAEKSLQLLIVAEQSGTLSDMFTVIATDYAQELDQKLSLLSKILEPAIISALGFIIGGIIVTLYLPIFTLGESIK